MSRIFTLAAVLAFLQLAATTATAQYYATVPWCAVISLGAGDVHWDCIYGSIEQCRTTTLAGNRGFCNSNPYYVGAAEPR